MAVTKLYNPLDEYNTYSVHYVMLACRTTEDAKVFTDEEQNESTLSSIEKVRLLGDPVSHNGRSDVAYLVMDTRRFSQFTISRLKYEALINGITRGEQAANLTTIVEMEILDSVGISFINFLQWLMDYKMQCNFDGMVYMLRLIFTGHNPDGTTTTVQTITIPMHLLKLELNLDYAKGAYTAEFMPNSNFSVKDNARWLQVGSATSFVATDNKLGTIVNSFQERLNELSAAYFGRAKEVINKARGEAGTNFGRQVKYMITIPQEWEKLDFTGSSTIAATETDHKAGQNGVGKVTSTTFSTEAGLTITDVLDRMFKQTKGISELGNGQRTEKDGGSVTFYKHYVSLSSDNSSVIVHVDVLPFKVPNVVANQSVAATQGASDLYRELQDESGKLTGIRVPREYMEFDYIFTGKNTTVLNFDMKLQDLQWMLASNLEIGYGAMQSETLKGQGDTKQATNPVAELVMARRYDPLLLPQNTEAELKNFTDYAALTLQSTQGKEMIKSRQDYTRNLSAFYAASPITVMMTIKGNPLIMAKFVTSKIIDHKVVSDKQSKDSYRKWLEDEVLRLNTTGNNRVPTLRKEDGTFVVQSIGDASYATGPVFVKVNVKGPAVDFATSELVNAEQFAEDVLYNNYYVVMKVTNTIEGSNFTQELELWSHNVFGHGKMEGPPNKTVNAQTAPNTRAGQ